ncbi:hypothetical protein ACNJU9_21545, partial [Mycobacterium tuberculosis]
MAVIAGGAAAMFATAALADPACSAPAPGSTYGPNCNGAWVSATPGYAFGGQATYGQARGGYAYGGQTNYAPPPPAYYPQPQPYPVYPA